MAPAFTGLPTGRTNTAVDTSPLTHRATLLASSPGWYTLVTALTDALPGAAKHATVEEVSRTQDSRSQTVQSKNKLYTHFRSTCIAYSHKTNKAKHKRGRSGDDDKGIGADLDIRGVKVGSY